MKVDLIQQDAVTLLIKRATQADDYFPIVRR